MTTSRTIRPRAFTAVVAGALLAGVAGLVVATQASATAPAISRSQTCIESSNAVSVTLGAPKSWWNFEISSNTGLSISTETASTSITFTVPRSKVPTTLVVRYKLDTQDSTTVVIDAPSCVEAPPTPPAPAPTTIAPGAPGTPGTPTEPGNGGSSGVTPTTPGGAGNGTTPTTAPTRVEGSTTTKSKSSAPSSGGAPKVKVGQVNFAG